MPAIQHQPANEPHRANTGVRNTLAKSVEQIYGGRTALAVTMNASAAPSKNNSILYIFASPL